MTEEPESTGFRLDRRGLLRAGAWAAPAITLAVASPAAAASPSPPTGTLAYDFIWYGWEYSGAAAVALEANTQIQFLYDGASGELPVITFTVTIANADGFYAVATPTILQGAPDWSATPSAMEGDELVLTFVWAGTTPLRPGFSTIGLRGRVPLTAPATPPPAPQRYWSAVASAPGVTPAVREYPDVVSQDGVTPTPLPTAP